jgi:hypothetical protein
VGIDRYDRLALVLEGLGTTGHVLAWRLPVGVGAPLQGLPVGLEAVPQIMEQAIARPRTHQMPLRPQGGRSLGGTCACPPEEGHRVPTGDRIDQRFSGMQEVWSRDAQRFASSASTAQPFGRSLRTGHRVRAGQFLHACPHGDPGEPGRFGDAAHTSSSQGAGFHRGPRAACALIQERPQDEKLSCNGLACWVLHRADRNTLKREMDRLFWRAS